MVDITWCRLDRLGRFLRRLYGLGDVEYFWEPVPDCWSAPG